MGLAAFNRMRRLAAEQAAQAQEEDKNGSEIEELRAKAKDLGIERAHLKGEKRLREEIATAEAVAATLAAAEELVTLQLKAAEFGVEEIEGKDAETLRKEIAEKGGGGNADYKE